MYMINLEQNILMNYPKFVTLNEANKIFQNSKYASCDRLNLYIDATQIIHSLYGLDPKLEPQYGIVSGLINLCAHLRDYYARTFGCMTRIFIVYSSCMCAHNIALYPKYYSAFYKDKAANSAMDIYIINNIKMLKMTCQYIDDVYFVPTNVEPVVKMYDLITKEQTINDKIPHIIFSKDVYMLLVLSRLTDTFIFKLTKTKQEYITIGDHENCLELYYRFSRNGIHSTEELFNSVRKIDPSMMACMLTLTGSRYRNITMFKNLTTAVKILSEYAQTLNSILYSYNTNIADMYDAMSALHLKIDKTSFLNRWRCIDVIYQHMMYNTLAESQDNSWLINLRDPNGVKEVNDKYFIKNPLDLNRL